MTRLDLHTELTISRLGQRGEGLARFDGGMIAVPYALPGETVLAEVDGDRAKLVEVRVPSPDRVPAFCPVYGICGGCAVQALAPEPYADWKRGLVVDALKRARFDAPVAALVDAHGEGRRRATFHSRVEEDAGGRKRILLGFMQARAHRIVPIEACPILSPGMAGAIQAAHAAATVLIPLEKPLDIVVTSTLEGLDVDLRGTGTLDFGYMQALITVAARFDLARISNHGVTIIERRPPLVRMGRCMVAPPPGGFLQATAAGEEAIAGLVRTAVGSASKIVDLFAGSGTFALRLAEHATIHAVEGDKGATNALARGAGGATGLRGVSVETRDLFLRPLAGGELTKYDAVVFDPPRAGAEEQAKTLALSQVPLIVGVSCNLQSFTRDARILADGGYVLEHVTPVDQFRYSAHVELVGVFRRPPAPKPKRRGRLLG
jgi:23S rRNA (uracil1939-C5)-methyltransferase